MFLSANVQKWLLQKTIEPSKGKQVLQNRPASKPYPRRTSALELLRARLMCFLLKLAYFSLLRYRDPEMLMSSVRTQTTFLQLTGA